MRVHMQYDVTLADGTLVKAGEEFEMPDDEAAERARAGNVTIADPDAHAAALAAEPAPVAEPVAEPASEPVAPVSDGYGFDSPVSDHEPDPEPESAPAEEN